MNDFSFFFSTAFNARTFTALTRDTLHIRRYISLATLVFSDQGNEIRCGFEYILRARELLERLFVNLSDLQQSISRRN